MNFNLKIHFLFILFILSFHNYEHQMFSLNINCIHIFEPNIELKHFFVFINFSGRKHQGYSKGLKSDLVNIDVTEGEEGP